MFAEQTFAANSTRRSLQQNLFFLLQNLCKSPNQLSQIHAQITTNGFSHKAFILTKLLSLYASFDDFPRAQQLFDHVSSPSTPLWNQIIRGHSISGDPRKSVESFAGMARSPVLPDEYTYNYVISSCTKGGLSAEGRQVHGKVLKIGFCSNVHVSTSLVDFYTKNGGIVEARKVFDETPVRNVATWNSFLSGCFRFGDIDCAREVFGKMPVRNLVSWTVMISGYARNGRCKDAIGLFHQMRRENVEFDQVTLVAVLSACAEVGDLSLGKWVHAHVFDSLISQKRAVLVSLNNALIHMYASCGEIDAAFGVFRRMDKRTTISWTSIITGFAKHGYANEALSVFQWMSSLDEKGNINIRPDEITFLGLLCACSHAGYVDLGRYYFRAMTDEYGLEPKIEHFGCMVDLLSRAGLLDEAHEMVKSMPMRPNDVVWGALLGGCRIHKSVDLALEVGDLLTNGLDPDRAGGYLVLLSNVCAASDKWGDVSAVRRKMADSNAKKPPGRSWIQVEREVYEFFAGDWSNENAGSIYDVLDDVTREARFRGDVTYFQ
ncbi:Pentatricopeptide repeat-containing protein [Striga hermonthica]|uniref:Pentatricopeptide repeat-containing protein n=1 Tax=Striga hermonthica TaxID=68872 RepID=A0A9N7RLL8_STRHE|nr:Pentatricopeptide repeat-containing protein [Striga hermonthica]